ncbi:methyltransferase domain-containing protein [Leptolyngbya sp. GGD]|uniref:methyltransferase domain-containing protein n=1 Tax=Leptolyngbya sp. GGD TaxID=2997907 RepID=UPI00227A5A42|nr:class I SAM-dependent methyltransferase [Leptolyngbya sp. GGD]MCY6491697.1 class I SAM-dependent methyltransferase [Leptolyngbya sp. GGD]
MSYLLLQGQQVMTLDARRNAAYLQAMQAVITPDSVVLDLGAGLGIFGLLAAQLGAKRVYMVEPEDIISLTQQIVKANGYSDRIQCLQGKIEEVTIPEPVDVIISVFTGNFLLSEDLLPSLFYARDRYLKPGGVLIPSAAVMETVPASVPAFYEREIAVWSNPHLNLDHSPVRSYVSQAMFFARQDLGQAQYLAEPEKVMALDFYQATDTNCRVEIHHTITQAGICHGWIGWFKMLLGDQWLSTAPHEPPLHWSSAFMPIDPPVAFEVGETVTFKLQRPPYGDWIWQFKSQQTQQQRSTFFSVPNTLKTLQKMAPAYQPNLNTKGKAVHYILAHADGTHSVQELAQQLVSLFPDTFATDQKATKFIQTLVSWLA